MVGITKDINKSVDGFLSTTTDRDRYFVRKGLVRLFHDAKR